MAGVKVKLEIKSLTKRLNGLLHAIGDLRPVMEEASRYMVRSTRHRVFQGHRDPDTDKVWAPLSPVTVQRKGNDRPLFLSGTLADSIQAINVTNHGFMIQANARDERGKAYSSFHHRGTKNMPRRRFLGFSDENEKRIARMLRDHINDHISAAIHQS